MIQTLILLEVDVAGGRLATLVDDLGDTLVVQSLELEREECAVRIAFAGITAGRYEVDDA